MKRIVFTLIGCIAAALIAGCAGTSTPQGIVDAGNPDIDSIEAPGTTTTSYVHEGSGIAFDIAAKATITPDGTNSFYISPANADESWNVKATIVERTAVHLFIMEQDDDAVEMRVMNLDGQRYEIIDQDDGDFTAALKIMEPEEEVTTVVHYSDTHVVRLEGFFPADAVDAIAISYAAAPAEGTEEQVEMRVMRPQGETPPTVPMQPVVLPNTPSVGAGVTVPASIGINRIAPGNGDAE